MDPQHVRNKGLLQRLTATQMAALQVHGFVVVPARHAQFYSIYQRAAAGGEPVFVTTDALLHTYHIPSDYTLRVVEIEHLVNDLTRLTTALLDASAAQLGAAQPGFLRRSAGAAGSDGDTAGYRRPDRAR